MTPSRHGARPAWLLLALGLAAGLPACSDEEGSCANCPEPLPAAPGALFFEPTAWCLAGDRAADSLHVYNLGDTTLVWNPVHVPAGLEVLDGRLELAPGTVVVMPWTWDPPGPFPVVDSLVAETNDPRHLRVVLPIVRHDPEGPAPPAAEPLPPLLAVPADGAVVAWPDTVVDLAWSREAACGGTVRWRLFVSPEPDFSSGVLTLSVDDAPTAQIVFDGEGRDRGVTLYWRVRVTANGLTSAFSATRRIEHR